MRFQTSESSLSLSPSLNVDDDDDEPPSFIPFPSHAATVCHDQPMHRMRLRRQRRRLPRVMLGRRRRKNQHESHNFVSRVIPSHTPSFLPLPVLIIHSFALSLTHRVLLSFTLFLPSVYSISHHDMTAFSQFEFTNGMDRRTILWHSTSCSKFVFIFGAQSACKW